MKKIIYWSGEPLNYNNKIIYWTGEPPKNFDGDNYE